MSSGPVPYGVSGLQSIKGRVPIEDNRGTFCLVFKELRALRGFFGPL